MKTLVARAFALSCLLVAGASWAAATPAVLTLTAADRDVAKTSTDGPFLVANFSYTQSFVMGLGGIVGLEANSDSFSCDATINPCGIVDVVVDVPADYPALHPTDKVRITLSWVSQESDLDMHVYKGAHDTTTGNFFRQSRQNPPAPEAVEFFVEPGRNTYRVYTVPAAPAAASTTVTAVLQSGPTPTGPTTVRLGGPTFANYTPPSNLSSYTNDAGEPTLGVNLATNKAYMMFRLDTIEASWDDATTPATVSWRNMGPLGAPTTADPFITMDQHRLPNGDVNHRIWVAQLLAANSYMAYTDIETDCALVWTDTTRDIDFCRSTGAGEVHGVDNQSIAVGPYPNNTKPASASPARTYPHAMYYCSHQSANAFCSRSDDGGQTFNPSRPIFGAADACGNHGHVKVGADGTVYVPMNNPCQGAEGVTISIDSGETWHYLKVPGTSNGRWDSSIAISNDGKTVWYGYAELNDDRPMMIKGILDKSDVNNPVINWIEPAVDVGAPAGLKNIAFNTVVAGDKDRAAYIFHGTTATGNSGDVNSFSASAPWYLYAAMTFDGGRTWELRNITPDDPIQRGVICDGGLGSACESAGTRNLLDFMDADIDGEGRIVIAYADGCVGAACIAGTPGEHSTTGKIARQVSGKRMLAAFDPADPNGPPDAPSLSATRDAFGSHLAWVAPASSSPLTGYDIQRSTNGGAFVKIATVAGSATKYSDRTAIDVAKTYAYQVVAISAMGRSTASNAVAPVLPADSACTFPGQTMFNDATGDQVGTEAGANKHLDIQWQRIAENFTTASDESITFVLKVDGITEPVQPNSEWKVSFNVVDTTGVSREMFVEMDTTDRAEFAPVFSYGYSDGNDTGQGDGGGIVTGTYSADGTITIKVKANVDIPFSPLTAVPGDPPLFKVRLTSGTVFSGVEATTYVIAGAYAFGGGAGLLQTMDTGGAGSYTSVGNAFCRPNTAPVAALTAAPASGTGPLTVTFDASASTDSDAGDSIVNYVFDFGDGSQVMSSATPVVSHTYESPGAFGMTLRVQDTRGKLSTSPANRQIVVEEASVDADDDGIEDDVDNCPSVANPEQENVDGDALGDACDPVDDRDLTPDAFSFVTRPNVANNVYVTSETRAITGISAPVQVSVSSGQYRINSGAWTSGQGTAVDGDSIAVRHISASGPNQTTTTYVTVGTYTTTFESVTTAIDRTPDAFGFDTQSGVELGTVIESNVITPEGYTEAASVSAGPGASFRINGGAWATSGTINPGETLQTRHTSSSSNLSYTKTYVKVGGVTGYFTTRTK